MFEAAEMAIPEFTDIDKVDTLLNIIKGIPEIENKLVDYILKPDLILKSDKWRRTTNNRLFPLIRRTIAQARELVNQETSGVEPKNLFLIVEKIIFLGFLLGPNPSVLLQDEDDTSSII